MSMKRLLWIVLWLTALRGEAAVHYITTAAGLQALTLQPGDEVVWRAGTYSNQTINFLGQGTAGQPIVLRAETRGEVVFTGNSALRIGGSHLVVDGFLWDESVGLGTVIEFRRSGSTTDLARDCVLRHCVLRGLQTTGDTKSTWIRIYGYRNTVEYCSLISKRSTGEGILVELAYNDGTPAGHQIRHNYFHDFPSKDGRTNANDSEAIRVGVSSLQTVEARVNVENNYFLEVNSENEIISNKSRGNRYVGNTFRRSRGALVLRHGAAAHVEGNFFMGEGAANSGGVRISDQDHVVINNYMTALRGTTWNAAITWVAGNTTSGGTSSGYQNVANVVVAHNTVVDCTQSIYFNDQSGTRAPVTSMLVNNILSSSRGPLIQGTDRVSPAGIQFAGNLLFGAAAGYVHPGNTEADPQLELVGGLLQPAIGSPARDAAVALPLQVERDLRGARRPIFGADVGAIEVLGAGGSGTRRPWTDIDVGRGVGAANVTMVDAWMGYPHEQRVGPFTVVDTGDWLGTVWLAGDWVFVARPGVWLWWPDAASTAAASGGWAYRLTGRS
jgi:poly(beta-D-mannuronate) lyase